MQANQSCMPTTSSVILPHAGTKCWLCCQGCTSSSVPSLSNCAIMGSQGSLLRIMIDNVPPHSNPGSCTSVGWDCLRQWRVLCCRQFVLNRVVFAQMPAQGPQDSGHQKEGPLLGEHPVGCLIQRQKCCHLLKVTPKCISEMLLCNNQFFLHYSKFTTFQILLYSIQNIHY